MTISEQFLSIGEYYAAGLFEDEGKSLFFRHSRALQRFYENVPLQPYHGELLYPCGDPCCDTIVHPTVGSIAFSEKLRDKSPELYAFLCDSDVNRYHSSVPKEHTVAGDMWTHSMPDYERILREGLSGYEARVLEMKDEDLREGLLLVLNGIRRYHERCLEKLIRENAPAEVIERLRKVPFSPATDIYEAIAAWNFAFYLDSCDNPGALAVGLEPYYRGETDILPYIRALYKNCDDANGYSLQIGIHPTALDRYCIQAVRGLRRPMIEFFVDEKTDPEVLKEAIESVKSGCGQPAFYNKTLFLKAFGKKLPEVTEEDLQRFCGGGCAESMISGLSNVGSLDAGINLVLILEETMKASLESAESFEAFYETYMENCKKTVHTVAEGIRKSQEERARWLPRPMRTLLIGDCISKELEYNRGGARYLWSVVNFAGTVNVIDALLVLRDKVFRERTISAGALLRKLSENDAAFLAECKANRNAFGRDDPEINAFTEAFTARIFGTLDGEKPWMGSCFLPSSIQFLSYGDAGRNIGATPDGRCCGEALADSLSAIFGKDSEGPTAMLKSVAAMKLESAIGTPIVNLTVRPDFDDNILKALILGYFSEGGIQLQISCVSKEILLDAYEHPENHQNLIVRVGGYSEYFNRLQDDIKLKIIERNIA